MKPNYLNSVLTGALTMLSVGVFAQTDFSPEIQNYRPAG